MEGGGDGEKSGGVVDAEELVASVGGIGEWAEEVEDSWKGEGLSNGGGVSCGGMMVDGEAETDAGLLEAASLDGRRGFDVNAECGEQLGGASSGAAAVAVLGDEDSTVAGGGDNEGSDGGDVEGFGCTAGAAGVKDDSVGRGLDGECVSSHGAGGAGEFIDGDAACLDEGKKGGDLGLGDVPLEDEFDGGLRVVLAERLETEEGDEKTREIHGGR